MGDGRDRVKISLLAGAIVVCAGIAALPFLPHSALRTPAITRSIPASGVAADNDTGGKVPGDPRNGIQDLEAIYALLARHKGRSDEACAKAAGQGRARARPGRLMDVAANPALYGLRDRAQALDLLTNPDTRYGDAMKSARARIIPYSAPCYRHDGTMVGGPGKAPGTRDVIAYTSLYQHDNIRRFPGEKMTYNPVGFYLVLWDDGIVEKVPYHDVLFAKNAKGTRTLAFRGQAGVLPGVMTYDEHWARLGMRGPRGAAGGEGQSPEELSLNPRK